MTTAWQAYYQPIDDYNRWDRQENEEHSWDRQIDRLHRLDETKDRIRKALQYWSPQTHLDDLPDSERQLLLTAAKIHGAWTGTEIYVRDKRINEQEITP